MDIDGYPTEEELAIITNWSIKNSKDILPLMTYVKDRWKWSDTEIWNEEIKKDGIIWHISTVGWSGNESLIAALMANTIFWLFAWWSSRRGGHYVFTTCPIGIMLKEDKRWT